MTPFSARWPAVASDWDRDGGNKVGTKTEDAGLVCSGQHAVIWKTFSSKSTSSVFVEEMTLQVKVLPRLPTC